MPHARTIAAVIVTLVTGAAAAVVAAQAKKPATATELGGAERFLAFVATDKPIYRVGETVYVRVWALEARTRVPHDKPLQAAVTIKGPKGDLVTSGGVSAPDGVAGFSWDVPSEQPGGEYKVVVSFQAQGIPSVERTFDVRSYRAPRLSTQIDFERDGYGAGDEVRATLHVTRAEGGVPKGARVTVTARVDDVEIHRGETTVDASGLAKASFELPARIARGEGTLAMTVEDGGVVETATKTIPILLSTLDLTMFPEGGDLVVGVPSRLYFEARTPAKKPADIEAVIVDDQGHEAAACRTEHEGRGRCTLTPRADRTYKLEIRAPAGITKAFVLPAAKSAGATLLAASEVVSAGAPARFRVGATKAGKYELVVSRREVEVGRASVQIGKSAVPKGDAAAQLVSLSVPLEKDADGVLIATLWGEGEEPLAERLVFRAPARRVHVSIKADSTSPEPGAKATLEVVTTDDDGKPVSALVGVTVTDESVLEMKERRERAPRLPVMVLLEPEVRELADAEIYLDPEAPKAPLATDLLLGTQGWRRFALLDVQRFMATYGDAARRVLAFHTAPPMVKHAGYPSRAYGRGGEDLVPSAAPVAGPPMAARNEAPMVRAPSPAVARPQPASPRLAEPGPMRPSGARVAATRPGFVMVREYAHAARPDRQPDDRVDFTETLYFSAGVRTDAQSGRASVSFDLSDSVTTFRVAADAVSSEGTLGAGTLGLATARPFYIEPKLPLQLSSGDLVQIPVALVNATTAPLGDVHLSLAAPAGMQVDTGRAVTIAAGERGRALLRVDTSGFSGRATLVFEARAGNYSDKVTRELDVRPRGFPGRIARGGMVERDGRERVTLSLPADTIDGSVVTEAALYPTPLANLTQALQSLLREPNGCFEQTSSTSYPLTMAQQYFTTHAGVDEAIVRRSRELLQRGYKRLVGFECKEKGYEWFGGAAPGHEALTAYGLMQFGDMRQAKLTMVDGDMLERTRAWLLSRRDGKGGFWRNQRALDSFGGAPEETTNAYIVWALLEAGERGLEREIAAVEQAAAKADDSYLVALGANVAVLAKHGAKAKQLMTRLAQSQEPGGVVKGARSSITRSGGVALEVETTSLATLAWLTDPKQAGAVEQAIRFIAGACQGGRFASTQATVLALKAIVAYDAARNRARDAGSVRAQLDGKSAGPPVRFDGSTQEALALPDFSSRLAGGEHVLELSMEGGSRMPYSVLVTYNAGTPASADSAVLTLATTLKEATLREGDITELRVDVANPSRTAVASPVAVIGVPGGLEVRHDQLKELVRSERIAAYEVLGREVVLYWRQLDAGAKVTLPLSLVAAIPGRYTAPASRVYPYYTDEAKRWVAGVTADIQ